MKNYLLDKDFLNKLSNVNQREVYVRLTALTKDELPIEYIEGKATTGQISVDGNSVVRRTCSLSLVAKDLKINEYYWGLHNKFKLEVGLKNNINKEYDDIIWFEQGLYVITQFNCNTVVNNYTVSISGKDKMCLLNGDVSGNLPHMVDFGIEEEYDENGNTTYREIPIIEIIREAVQNFGNELAQNIVINDIEDAGVEILEYRGDTPLYLLKNVEDDVVVNMTPNGSQVCYVNGQAKTLDSIEKYDNFCNLNPDIEYVPDQVKISTEPNAKTYTVAKIEYGSIPGYRLTDLTYAGDLIANVGESLTSVLDKIKNMLGNFEYFYDLKGRFVFQMKKNYVDVPLQATAEYDELRPENMLNLNSPLINLLDNRLITSFQNNIDFNNLKNDYAVWGVRKTPSGIDVPIHMRFAIDIKPEQYTVIRPGDNFNKTYNSQDYDWRELIYQMAKDYRKCYHDDDFLIRLAQANPQYPTGKTGYEQYYVDMEGFWRELYNPFEIEEDNKRNPLEIYNPEDYNSNNHWAKILEENPENLNFWFDFLQGDLEHFSVQTVGRRPKAINDNNIKAIYYREIPLVLFTTEKDEQYKLQTGYTYIQLQPQMQSLFTISSIGKSAFDQVNTFLYQYSYCAENVTVNMVPIYYLEPNTRIYIRDEKSNIDGEYNVTRMTIPLTFNGLMSVNGTKAVKNITY